MESLLNKQGISVAQFFESNGIPYHMFEKWYKKRMQPSSVVDCVVSGVHDETPTTAVTQTVRQEPKPSLTVFCKLKDCVHVCCWAHVRRIFDSALRDYKDGKAWMFIDLISCLYKVEVENVVFGRTERDIVKARRSILIPVLNELIQKANSMLERYNKKLENMSSKLHQTLTYMVKNWKELIGYVNVGNVQIDNNCCERAVRPFTNLRKSFGGFSSENGARRAATILSFVEACKLMKKNVLGFLKDFFDIVISGRTDYDHMALASLGVNKK